MIIVTCIQYYSGLSTNIQTSSFLYLTDDQYRGLIYTQLRCAHYMGDALYDIYPLPCKNKDSNIITVYVL